MTVMKDKEFKDDAASVKSARRVLSIFRYFEKVRTPRTLSEVSQDLGYPISSTLALLRSIQTLGCLTYNLETKTYFPSMRFAMLGLWIPERLFAGGGIVKMMEGLANATQESALLSVQNGLFAQHIHIVATNQPLSYHPTVGTLRPLLTSAVGKVLLSLQPDDQVLKTVEKANAKEDGIAVDGESVLKELAQIRRDGYAYSANLFTPGAASVVVALPVREGDVPMTVSVGGPASRINRGAIPRVLKHIRAALDAMEHPGTSASPDEPVWQD